MNNKELTSLLIAAAMTVCLLTGCETYSTDTGQTDASAAETENTADNVSNVNFSFADISELRFDFSSGVGAWCTSVNVYEDGTFKGQFNDADAGDSGENYPKGTRYYCIFTGDFTEPQKVNDYTYSVKVESIELREEPGIVKFGDGAKYISSGPYGMEDAEEFLFFLPGAPVSELPEEYMDWVTSAYGTIDTYLPFYGLYNVNTQEGFASRVEASSVDDETADPLQEER